MSERRYDSYFTSEAWFPNIEVNLYRLIKLITVYATIIASIVSIVPSHTRLRSNKSIDFTMMLDLCSSLRAYFCDRLCGQRLLFVFAGKDYYLSLLTQIYVRFCGHISVRVFWRHFRYVV